MDLSVLARCTLKDTASMIARRAYAPALSLCCAALACALPARAESVAHETGAQSVYHARFERLAETIDWVVLPQCRVQYQARNGNPDGYLEGSCPDAPTGREIVVGARTESPEMMGDYAARRWSISVDLSQREGDSGEVWLMFHYRGLDGWLFNGWRYPLARRLGTGWHTYGVAFDASWTDEEARARGWQQEPASGFLSPDWATCMRRVGAVDLLLHASGSPVLGIDNFVLTEER
jgi:hypothetical protein